MYPKQLENSDYIKFNPIPSRSASSTGRGRSYLYESVSLCAHVYVCAYVCTCTHVVGCFEESLPLAKTMPFTLTTFHNV